jgi:phage-related protein
MGWGTVESSDEVRTWLAGLPEDDQAHVQFYVDLLENQGVLLGEPYTRDLGAKLRELRFHLGRARTRITYTILTGRRIVLLTVFAKTKMRETTEIERARRAMNEYGQS